MPRRSLGRGGFARVANAVTWLIIVWAWLWPSPYSLVIALLVAIPLLAVAIVATGRGLYSIEGKRNDVRPLMIAPVSMPGPVLMLRAMRDVDQLDPGPVVTWMPIAVVPLLALVVMPEPDRRARWRIAATAALLLPAYAWGALTLVDVIGDRATPEEHRAIVLDRRVTTGQYPSRELELGPWGEVGESDWYEVSPAVHRAAEVGSEVCVVVHPGALGARWSTIERCE